MGFGRFWRWAKSLFGRRKPKVSDEEVSGISSGVDENRAKLAGYLEFEIDSLLRIFKSGKIKIEFEELTNEWFRVFNMFSCDNVEVDCENFKR